MTQMAASSAPAARVTASGPKCKQGGGEHYLGNGGKGEQSAHALRMAGFVLREAVGTDHGEQRVVHELDRPDHADHEPRHGAVAQGHDGHAAVA